VEWNPDRPLYIGHRGARALSDENTLEGLKLAVELEVDMIEFDIQRTGDGVFVLMHDETVNRTTDGKGRVDEMTLLEFKQLKTERGYTPPTLEEVLNWLKSEEVDFILDFKISDPDKAGKLVDQVESHGLLDRAIFESPIPKVAGMVEALRPEVTTSIYPLYFMADRRYLVPLNMLGMRYFLKKYDIDVASYYYPCATLLEIVLVKKSGKEVIVWTVNSRGWVRWFDKLGVDGIMTDDPNLFK
jgi:glycerophosphoryl diester phosphodiesterase